MEIQSNDKQNLGAEFMLKEYERIHEIWMDENRQLEQRVNFFLAIASAMIGVIILIYQFTTLPISIASFCAYGVLIILLLFGITIINRLNSRSVQLNFLHRSLIEIQDYFATADSDIAKYLINQREIYHAPKHQTKLNDFINKSFTGTLSDFMRLINGLICGVIVFIALFTSNFSIYTTLIWTLATIIVSMRLIRIYNNFIRRRLYPWNYY